MVQLFKSRSAYTTPQDCSTPVRVESLDDNADIFSKSNLTLAQLEADKAARRQKREASRLVQNEKSNLPRDRSPKRRRVSNGSEYSESSDASDGKAVKPTLSAPHSTQRKGTPLASVRSSTPRSSPRKPRRTIISDDDEDEIEPRIVEQDKSTTSTYGSDDELEALARRARDRQRIKASQDEKSTAGFPISQEKEAPPDPLKDPAISILVYSEFPDTLPLIVKRRTSQKLAQVLTAWLDRQSLPPSIKPRQVFLIWRDHRVFENTTIQSLGVEVDDTGNVWVKKSEGPGRQMLENNDEEGFKLVMEATTLELWHKRLLQRHEEKMRSRVQSTDIDDSPSPKKKDGESKVRVILKSKTYEDYKLIVKPVCHPLVPVEYSTNLCV